MSLTIYPAAPPAGGLLTTGEEVFPRDYIAVSNLAAVTQSLKLMYFTARKTEVTTQVRLGTGSTAAGATPTICRVGLYTIDASNNAALVASTANDTTLFAASLTVYTRAWTAPYTKIAGQRYAVGHLVVSAVTMPSWSGQAFSASTVSRAEWGTDQRLAALLPGQSDLPSSFLNSATSTTLDGRTYMAILP